ncbi:MAG: SpoIIE family protein phosphatase, partial [Clostridia bacterium]|nr:SpoIIE family protein phosphatase [Clostridia bacterium]
MLEGTNVFFSKMVGTLAVILVVAAFIGGSELLIKFTDEKRAWKYSIIAGVLGGVFGVYGNISGVSFNGAVISVRDIGPMLAGFTGGPIGGLIAGLVAGLHRLFMGGITAQACVVATCSIGLICGFISQKYRKIVEKPGWAVVIGSVMEAFHLSIVLAMVKPFETALDIVRHIAIPFILVNAIGFTMMITIITYTERQRKLALERSRLQSELEVANVIQHSLLPVINESYPGREEIDVSAFMEAAKEVGGDFYDTFFVDKNHIAFVIGDVSGKGVPAALFMASSKIILQ